MAQEATVTRGVETAYRESAVGIKEDCFFLLGPAALTLLSH